jgi:NAD(P)-dependent dehydrogenase (short-subunit alcohol dehydrogenase family)
MALLEDKVAVVTNAGHGIGSGIARAMARYGARVVVNDPACPEKGGMAEQVVREIEESGGEAVSTTDQATSWEGSKRIIQSALDTFGRMDILVTTSCIRRDQMIVTMSEDEWNSVLTASLRSVFCCTRAAVRPMRKQKWGRLIHLTPIAGLVGSIGQANCNAAMMAVAGFSRNVAIEMERYRVTSNCIASLPFTAHASGASMEIGGERDMTFEGITLATVAPLAVYLASQVSQGVSGQIFGVRGKEMYLFSQSRIVRSVHHSQGWTVDELSRQLVPMMKDHLTPVETSDTYFSWDPMV